MTPTTTNQIFFLHNFQLWQKKEIVMVKRRNACYISLSLSPNNMCQEGIQIFRVLWDYYIYCNRGP